jgi:hypothetical protein
MGETERKRAKLLSQFPPKAYDWLLNNEMGKLFWAYFLAPKGTHLSILGYPGSGKTQKAIWLLNWLKHIETPCWFDTGKDEEIGPLFLRGKKVHIILPLNGDITISGPDLPEYSISYAITPGEFWKLIKPGEINIFSVRNFFYSENARSKYYSAMFRELSRMAYSNAFKKAGIERLSVFLDEAHQMVPSQSMTKDKERIKAGIYVTSNVLEVRAVGIRIITGTQDPMMILPAARKNLPVRLLCAGARIKSDESALLAKLCRYAEHYQVNEGLIVYPNGMYYPTWGPWPFPFFPKPKGIKIDYSGTLDKDQVEEETVKGYA